MAKEIVIVGLGAGSIDQLPLGVYRKLLASNNTIYVRTADHPVVQSLMNEGVSFQSFDSLYKNATEFEAVYEGIVNTLIAEVEKKGETIIYAVPGHPMLAEKTIQLLLKQTAVNVVIE